MREREKGRKTKNYYVNKKTRITGVFIQFHILEKRGALLLLPCLACLLWAAPPLLLQLHGKKRVKRTIKKRYAEEIRREK